MPTPHLPHPLRFVAELRAALDAMYERLDESESERSGPTEDGARERKDGSSIEDDLPPQPPMEAAAHAGV